MNCAEEGATPMKPTHSHLSIRNPLTNTETRWEGQKKRRRSSKLRKMSEHHLPSRHLPTQETFLRQLHKQQGSRHLDITAASDSTAGKNEE